jgi:hypothetical protein
MYQLSWGRSEEVLSRPVAGVESGICQKLGQETTHIIIPLLKTWHNLLKTLREIAVIG